MQNKLENAQKYKNAVTLVSKSMNWQTGNKNLIIKNNILNNNQETC